MADKFIRRNASRMHPRAPQGLFNYEVLERTDVVGSEEITTQIVYSVATSEADDDYVPIALESEIIKTVTVSGGKVTIAELEYVRTNAVEFHTWAKWADRHTAQYIPIDVQMSSVFTLNG